jgi:methylmalonyl-CoA/ethylmalonyl-CoA epimerase
VAENALGTNVVCQVAIIVRDIEKTLQAWAKLLGVEVPQWHITDTLDVSQMRYHGQPSEARAKLAFFKLGQVSLELIEPVGAPSTWQEFLDQHGEGLHHIAFMVQGMDRVLARLETTQIPLVQRGDYKGGRYAYVDGMPELGTVLELLENDQQSVVSRSSG